jgi:hypothetical protein
MQKQKQENHYETSLQMPLKGNNLVLTYNETLILTKILSWEEGWGHTNEKMYDVPHMISTDFYI